MADDTAAVSDEQVVALLQQYDADLALHRAFADELKRTLERLVETRNLRVHSVTARVKDRDELEKKIRRGQVRFTALCDVVDVVGLRIITHFPDEVDAIAGVVKAEFEIDQDRSTDKREILNPDQFGYLSLHYVAKLPERRLHTELQRYADCVFEVQIRSILQHAWAEIEHDLGYKSREAVPRHIRRRFSRLAGLLEVADEEFRAIRDELATYGERVEEDVRLDPSSVYIDKDSLAAYVRTSTVVAAVDAAMARASGCQVLPLGPEVSEWSELRARAAKLVGFVTVAQLDRWLSRNSDFIAAFAAAYSTRRGAYVPGASVAFAAHVRAAMWGGTRLIADYVRAAGYDDPDVTATVASILAAFEEAKETVPLPDPPPPAPAPT